MNPDIQQIQAETITSAIYIRALMQRLVSEHALLRVRLAGAQVKTSQLSTVMQLLSEEEGAMLLDEPLPQITTGLVARSQGLSAEALISGAILSFETTVERVVEECGLRLWRLNVPTVVLYGQARQQHRVKVASLSLPVHIAAAEGQRLEGVLQDISTGGLAIRLSQLQGLKTGRGYRCRIEYEEGVFHEVMITPTHAKRVAGELPALLGAQLYDKQPMAQNQWRRFVSELERRVMREGAPSPH